MQQNRNFKLIDREELQRNDPSPHILNDVLIKNGIALGFECSDSRTLLNIVQKHLYNGNSFVTGEDCELIRSLERASEESEVLFIVSYAVSIGINLYANGRTRLYELKIQKFGGVSCNYCDTYADFFLYSEQERQWYYAAHSFDCRLKYKSNGDLHPQIFDHSFYENVICNNNTTV